MQYGELGSSGIRISKVIMGTWQTGKAMWVGIEDAESTRAIRAAFDAGIQTFDTAEYYGHGHSERVLGDALADVRDRVVYATKVFPNHLKHKQVMDSCHASLKNLKTDVIDLYQIHWPAGSFGSKKVPIEETMGALNELKHQGKIRAIGVSNFSRTQLEEALRFGPVESLQPPYSLFWRQVERDAMPYCVDNGITVIAYSPMAQGILTGKFGPGHTFEKGDHRSDHRLFQPENDARVQAALARLRPVAERKGITLGQLALAWVVSHPNTCAIAGARNEAQILQSAAAADVSLSAADLEELDAIGRTVTDPMDHNPVQWAF